MVRKVLYLALAAAVLAFGLVGCNNIPSNYTVTQGLTQGPVTVFGKVVDQQTGTGIANATVYLKVNGNWVSANTMSSTTGGAEDQIGNFSISNLPAENYLPMVVKGPSNSSYLQIKTAFWTNDYSGGSDGLNSPISQDLGLIAMEEGISLAVRAYSNGVPLTKSDGSALPLQITTRTGGFAPSIENITPTRDTTDTNKYTFTIPQTYSAEYDWNCDGNGATHGITVWMAPIDADADSKYDYTMACTDILYNADDLISANADLTTSMTVAKITQDTVPAVLADNIRVGGNNDGAIPANEISFLAATDTLTLVLNEPVEFATSGQVLVEFSYFDNFKSAPTADAVTVDMRTSPLLSSDNTVITIPTPSGLTYAENQFYDVNATNLPVRAKNTAGADTVYDLGDTFGYMITRTGAGSIGDAALAVTVDNFNFCTNGAVITTGDTIAGCDTGGAVGAPMLLFPEPVWGTVALVSSNTNTTDITYSYAGPAALTGQGIVSSVTQSSTATQYAGYTYGAVTAGPVYAADLSLILGVANMNDDVAATATLRNSLTLEVNVYDVDGNVYHQVSNFLVK